MMYHLGLCFYETIQVKSGHQILKIHYIMLTKLVSYNDGQWKWKCIVNKNNLELYKNN